MAPSDKFTNIVHYVVWYFKRYMKNCHLGKIKLNKIVWLLDVAGMYREGRSMSGVKYYRKEKFGPVHPRVLKALDTLVDQGFLVRTVTDCKDPDQLKYSIDLHAATLLRAPGKAALSELERKYIRRTCKELGTWSAKSLSELSHDAVYRKYEIGEEIPLNAYLIGQSRKPTAKERAWAKKSLEFVLH